MSAFVAAKALAFFRPTPTGVKTLLTEGRTTGALLTTLDGTHHLIVQCNVSPKQVPKALF